MKRLSTVLLITLLVATGCTARVPLDPTRPIDINSTLLRGTTYQQDGLEISRDSIRYELIQLPDAHAQMSSANALKAIGLILGFLGPALSGWAAGPAASDDGDVDSGLVAGGAVAGVIGLGLGMAAVATFEDAVRTYNETFEPLNEPTDRSDPTAEIEENEASQQPRNSVLKRPNPRKPGIKISPIYAAKKDGGILGAHISF